MSWRRSNAVTTDWFVHSKNRSMLRHATTRWLLLLLSIMARGQHLIMNGHVGAITGLFSQNDEFLWSCGFDGRIIQWSMRSGTAMRLIQGPPVDGFGNIIVIDGLVFASSRNSIIYVYNATTGVSVRNLTGHTSFVFGLSLRPVTRRLVSVGQDAKLIEWSLQTLSRQGTSINLGSYAWDVMVVNDNMAYVGLGSGAVVEWNLNTRQKGRTFLGHATDVRRVNYANGYLFSGSTNTGSQMDYKVVMWSLQTALPVRDFIVTDDPMASVQQLLPWGSVLITGHGDGSIRKWDLQTGNIIEKYQAHSSQIWGMAVFNKTLVTGGADGDTTVKLWYPSFLPPILLPRTTAARTVDIGTAGAGDDAITLSSRADLTGSINSSLPQVNPPMSLWFFIAIVGGSALLFICSVAIIVWYRCRTKRRRPVEMDKTKSREGLLGLSQHTFMSTTMRTQQATLVETIHELSIPGFLELTFGQDFQQENYITKGGGGSLYTCLPLNADLVMRVGVRPLILKRVANSADDLHPQLFAGFMQELSLMWRFRDHPNFCKMYGYSLRPLCILMRMYEFSDLSKFIHGRGVVSKEVLYTIRRITSLYTQVSNAIRFMHANGFVHCDIKPENILLDADTTYELTAILHVSLTLMQCRSRHSRRRK